jgi:hypothetical protein
VRVGLVGCVKRKGPVAAPAGELYVSPLFAGRRRFVEASCDRWFILSARHGLVDPDEVVEPYDESLVAAGVGERHAWAERVLIDAPAEHTPGDLAPLGCPHYVRRRVAAHDLHRDLGAAGRTGRRWSDTLTRVVACHRSRSSGLPAVFADRTGPVRVVGFDHAPSDGQFASLRGVEDLGRR